ncbi:MAG: hypothetical protein K6F79_01190 [Saccharofermentans sp.]|nr:hypothetical protein [Saccharofermentans sp.]
MKNCNSCGAQNEDSTKYCTTCGAPFHSPEPEASPKTSYEPESTYQTESNYNQQSAYAPTYFEPEVMARDNVTYSGLAITGFIISIISIFCCGFTAPIGLIFSIIGLIVTLKKSKKGGGLAIAGLIISAILTMFIAASLIASASAIERAYKSAGDGDIEEFFEALESELEEMDEGSSGRGSRRNSRSSRDDDDEDDEDIDDSDLSVSSDWNDYEVSSDFETVTITYTDGIPDDFEFYDADFDDICDVLESNLELTDNFGVTHSFDRESYRRLVSMVFISPDEYDQMSLSRSDVVYMLSYLATVSYEMNEDGFTPDRAVYTEDDNTYDFYGQIMPNNIGRAVISFTDGNNHYDFDDAMCGDEICWQIDPSTPDTYRIGLSSNTLDEYPGGGVDTFTAQIVTVIDPLV